VVDLGPLERKKTIQEAWAIRSNKAKEIGLDVKKRLRMEDFKG